MDPLPRVLADRSLAQEDLGVLETMGFAVEQIDLQGMRSTELAARLGRSKVVFVCGGNPYHLLRHAILSGLWRWSRRWCVPAGWWMSVSAAVEVRGADWRIVPLG